MNNPYLKKYQQSYQQAQVETAPREQILLMLYDGAVKFLLLAKQGFKEKNIEKIHNNIVRAQSIITEFQATLDMENGGKFAQTLFSLYEYLNRKLIDANIKKREDYLDEVIRHISGLRDTWKEAIQKFKASGGVLDSNQMDRYSSSKTDDEDEDEYELKRSGDDGHEDIEPHACLELSRYPQEVIHREYYRRDGGEESVDTQI